MLKYVDVYRCSDGVALVSHHHNRSGGGNSPLRPVCELFRPRPVLRQDQLPMMSKAHVYTPACRASSLPELFSP